MTPIGITVISSAIVSFLIILTNPHYFIFGFKRIPELMPIEDERKFDTMVYDNINDTYTY